MYQASLYQRANNVQQHDAKEILDEYSHLIQWRADGLDAVLDVGCGSGNVLMELIYPILPERFDILMGTDISAEMITYARKCYANCERTKFRVLDIGCAKIPNDLCSVFDHVTSFYCLHWVQNQKQALRNIYQLLRDSGGDCLLVFLVDNPIYHVYKVLAKHTKWRHYMWDANQFISPLCDVEDPCAEYNRLLSEVGFTDCNVEVRNKVFIYEGLENAKANISAICPFLERIPVQQHDEFMDDLVKTVFNMKFTEPNANGTDFNFISSYKLLVAHARKPAELLSTVIDVEQRILKGIN